MGKVKYHSKGLGKNKAIQKERMKPIILMNNEKWLMERDKHNESIGSGINKRRDENNPFINEII